MRICQSANFQSLIHDPKPSMSAKYQLFDSREVAEKVEALGFNFTGMSIQKVRKPENMGYQKHVMIFDVEQFDSENKLQLLVKNSYNGMSCLEFDLGIYRFVCANGLVIGDNYFNYSFKHYKRFADQLDEAYYMIKHVTPNLIDNVVTLQKHEYSILEEKDFTEKALLLRHDSADIVSPDFSFLPKREEDKAHNVYTLYNRMQEYMMKGGYPIMQKPKHEGQEPKYRKAKPITNIDLTYHVNKNMWDYATELAA